MKIRKRQPDGRPGPLILAGLLALGIGPLPAAAEAVVHVVCPEGCRVMLDGELAGHGPLTLRGIAPGIHEVVLERPTATQRFSLVSPRSATVEKTLGGPTVSSQSWLGTGPAASPPAPALQAPPTVSAVPAPTYYEEVTPVYAPAPVVVPAPRVVYVEQPPVYQPAPVVVRVGPSPWYRSSSSFGFGPRFGWNGFRSRSPFDCRPRGGGFQVSFSSGWGGRGGGWGGRRGRW